MKQEPELENKPSRLTKEEVVWLNCSILALFLSRLGMGRYTFAYDLLERYVETIWILLLVFISVVVYMGPKGPVRTISLLPCIPMAILAALGSCAVATGFNEYTD